MIQTAVSAATAVCPLGLAPLYSRPGKGQGGEEGGCEAEVLVILFYSWGHSPSGMASPYTGTQLASYAQGLNRIRQSW